MIDAGIDLFEVVQISVRDMDIEKVFRTYGKEVSCHGGPDVQKLLVKKSSSDFSEEADH